MARADFVNFFGTHTPWSGYCLDAAFLAVAIWVLLGFKKCRMDGAQQNAVLVAMAFAIVAGLLCAVLFDSFFTGDWHTWTEGHVRRFGFTFTGWLAGFAAVFALCAHASRLGALLALNFLMPAMALAQAIGRVGCFVGGCCYGFACDFGVSYPPGSLPYSELGPVKVFPVQIVEAGCLLVLFFVCLQVAFRFRAAVYMLGVGLIRFVLEFFRGDIRGTLFGIQALSPQQILSIAFFVTGILFWEQVFDYTKDKFNTQIRNENSPDSPSVKRKQGTEGK